MTDRQTHVYIETHGEDLEICASISSVVATSPPAVFWIIIFSVFIMLYRQRFARRVSFSFYLAVHQEKPKQIRASLYIYISLFVGAAVAMIESAIPGIMRLYTVWWMCTSCITCRILYLLLIFLSIFLKCIYSTFVCTISAGTQLSFTSLHWILCSEMKRSREKWRNGKYSFVRFFRVNNIVVETRYVILWVVCNCTC